MHGHLGLGTEILVMPLRHQARKIRNRIRLFVVNIREPQKETFECPICNYTGPFMDVAPSTGLRRHAHAQAVTL